MSIPPATASPVSERIALAISPHLDDAIFSAGGTLARLARDGWQVVIATVFTRSMPNPTGFALACQLDKGLSADVDYMALRRLEDRRACEILGAQAVWMPYAEAPHRGYNSASALFAGLHDDDAVVSDIFPALKNIIASHKPSIVFGPQAIGGHVDHRALTAALKQIEQLPILWWQDYPYVERESQPALPYDEYFKLKIERHVKIDAAAVDLKIEASLAYASQIKFQFAGANALRRRMERNDTEVFRTDFDRRTAAKYVDSVLDID